MGEEIITILSFQELLPWKAAMNHPNLHGLKGVEFNQYPFDKVPLYSNIWNIYIYQQVFYVQKEFNA